MPSSDVRSPTELNYEVAVPLATRVFAGSQHQFSLLTDYLLFTSVYSEVCNWPRAVDNMASSLRSVEESDSRVSNKRQRAAMSRGDDKVVEIDTLRAFTIPKMKKAKHGTVHCFFRNYPTLMSGNSGGKSETKP